MKNLEEMQNEALIRIVDDDADLRKGLTFMLECAGWKSAAYPSARDFLTQDSPSIPGCLILDVQMAGMTGIELQHEMNRRGNTLPIIFLTGHGDIDMAVTAMIDGAANFIQKPPESGKLLAAIETCVSQSLKNCLLYTSDAEECGRDFIPRGAPSETLSSHKERARNRGTGGGRTDKPSDR